MVAWCDRLPTRVNLFKVPHYRKETETWAEVVFTLLFFCAAIGYAVYTSLDMHTTLLDTVDMEAPAFYRWDGSSDCVSGGTGPSTDFPPVEDSNIERSYSSKTQDVVSFLWKEQTKTKATIGSEYNYMPEVGLKIALQGAHASEAIVTQHFNFYSICRYRYYAAKIITWEEFQCGASVAVSTLAATGESVVSITHEGKSRSTIAPQGLITLGQESNGRPSAITMTLCGISHPTGNRWDKAIDGITIEVPESYSSSQMTATFTMTDEMDWSNDDSKNYRSYDVVVPPNTFVQQDVSLGIYLRERGSGFASTEVMPIFGGYYLHFLSSLYRGTDTHGFSSHSIHHQCTHRDSVLSAEVDALCTRLGIIRNGGIPQAGQAARLVLSRVEYVKNFQRSPLELLGVLGGGMSVILTVMIAVSRAVLAPRRQKKASELKQRNGSKELKDAAGVDVELRKFAEI